ncbi:AAA family ATPase [Amycolatopsis sp. NBC_01480]|uniref:AAA family ATPase n=1 Tax=Amycolatopsis sp. NBC_01480 TaxID=2903562 RepID=UPI002E2B905C|nr:AAA family ATPase [Amycolatopsis sp. NBC_01480]
MTGPGDLQRGSSVLEVARAFRTDIEAGKYRHQEQLPTTRVLADEWKTSVATITRAMAQLADEGLVINRDRAGRLVNYPGPDQHERGGSRRPEPMVIVVGGYAGSGKTETGRIIARATGWAMLDKDSITRPVVESMLRSLGLDPRDRESETYLTKIRPAEYESLREVALENVACGNSVIVTAPFTKELKDPAWCQRFIADFSAHSAQVRGLWVRCDEESMRTYLRRRGAARDDYKLENWDAYVAGLDMTYTPAMAQHVILNNSIQDPPLHKQTEQVLERWGVHAHR